MNLLEAYASTGVILVSFLHRLLQLSSERKVKFPLGSRGSSGKKDAQLAPAATLQPV